MKAKENFFLSFAYPDMNTRGVGRILNCYANPRRILQTPLVFISGYANKENVFYCLNGEQCYIFIVSFSMWEKVVYVLNTEYSLPWLTVHLDVTIFLFKQSYTTNPWTVPAAMSPQRVSTANALTGAAGISCRPVCSLKPAGTVIEPSFGSNGPCPFHWKFSLSSVKSSSSIYLENKWFTFWPLT